MASYVVLATFTEQGAKNVRQTIERAEAFRHMAGKCGVTIKDMYWTLGSRDVVVLCDAPNDEAATSLSLSVSARGNVHAETLRAFSEKEMTAIVGKMI